MSDNFSSPTNTTLLYECFDVHVIIFISGAFAITKFFLQLPLSIFILHLGHQRWRQQRSFKTTSHSDFFTLHMAALELISELGSAFHILTCVERYLAVVHPVTYLGLKQSGGIRIRNISTGCVWLLCFGWMGVTTLYKPALPIIPFFSFLVLSFSRRVFLQHLGSSCSGPSGAGGGRQGQGAGGPIKKKGFLHHHDHTGGVVAAVCRDSHLSRSARFTTAEQHRWLCGVDICNLVQPAQQFGVSSAVPTPGRKTSHAAPPALSDLNSEAGDTLYCGYCQ
ncbi:hypothetical protein L3Q82_016443 [Scortum barcoo]|uniref:Uncharacterized protein n=1 Tax=Scortum barcoo TaxID=214431 RepID=A0ACB8X7Y2_9TELE|nr:hypothetical protein L3Q82_016443 [Scortum barcoo]